MASESRYGLDLSGLTYRDLLSFYFRHQFRILTIFVAATVVATGLVYYFPEKYEIYAKLMVKMGRENASVSPTITNPTIWTIGKQMKEVMNSEKEILGSTYLVERLIEELGLEFFDPPRPPPDSIFGHLKHFVRVVMRGLKGGVEEIGYALDIIREVTPEEEAVLGIQKALLVAAEPDSNVIAVVFKWPDPDVGRATVDKLIELYLDYRIEVYTNAGVYAFFRNEVQSYRDRLEVAAAELAEFKNQTGIAEIEKQKESLLDRVLERRASRDEARARVAELEVAIAAARAQQQETGATEVMARELQRNPMIALYEAKLVDLEAERSQLKQRYDNGVPMLAFVEREIAALRALIASSAEVVESRVETGANPTYKNLENEAVLGQVELAKAQARLETEGRLLGEVEARLAELNRNEVEFKRLALQLSSIEDHYLLHQRKLEEARIEDALDTNRIANVTVAAPAATSILPLKKMRFVPRKLYYIALAMIAGLAIGVVYCLLIDFFDHTVRDESDAERHLGVRALGGFFESDELGGITGPEDREEPPGKRS